MDKILHIEIQIVIFGKRVEVGEVHSEKVLRLATSQTRHIRSISRG